MLDINASTDASFYSSDYFGQYSSPKMISWNSTSSDCCTWEGVKCHGITGHVIGLDLSCSGLSGVIHHNSSLFRLSHLQKLNLADNEFNGSEFPPTIGGLSRSLTHLNLSGSGFIGIIPSELFHLSKLVLLDLSYGLRFSPGDFQILLRNLTNVRVLSLSGVDISTTLPVNWSLSSLTYLDLEATGMNGELSNSIFHLPRLQKLMLSGNENLKVGLPKSNRSNTSPLMVSDLSDTNCLSDQILDSVGSFASLTMLGLSSCGLCGSLPNSIGNLSQIVLLDLRSNNFTGNFPSAFLNFPKLTELYLGDNSFTGPFPSHIGNLTKLTVLHLVYNLLSGPLPSNISGLRKLSRLYLSFNAFDGTIPSWLFSLPSLTDLFLRNNRLIGQIKEFRASSLLSIALGSNQLDGPIPDSILRHVNLTYLDLSSNNLSGSIEFTMFSNLNKLQILLLSNNKLSLKLANKINISFPDLYVLGLSSCEIMKFPNFLRNAKHLNYLDLSNNKLHNQIPNWIPRDSLGYLNLSHNSLSSLGSAKTLPLMKNLGILDLKSNHFQEPLPLSICNFEVLHLLDLSENKFTGIIPECFGKFSNNLQLLNLAKNELKGTISVTFPKDNMLMNLNLNGNLLEGPLPRSLANCKYLQVLDVGNNRINDTFPTFLENLMELQVLILKSNRLSGSLISFKNENFLPKLRVFDLSFNEFIGVLPLKLLKSLKAMISSDKIGTKASYMGISTNYGNQASLHPYTMSFVMKGYAAESTGILTTLVVIDLSSNSFTGDIPEIIGNLNSLIVLNLSHNNFSGHIPSALGKLYCLESLDLSWNQIEGEIPWQLADLTYLGVLNLSQNHLVGRIPQGKQFNTFLNDSYYGNLGLCGFPVTKNCGETDLSSPPSQGSYQDEEDSSFWSGFTWQSVLIGYGFGFAIGCLVFFTGKPKWLVRNIEELCWYGLLLLGKREMCKQLTKKSRRDRKHCRRNN